MQEKVSIALSVVTIVAIVGYMVFQYLTTDNNPHLRKAYSGRMELYHAAQLATKYEQTYEHFLNGRRWPGSRFGLLKHCPLTVINDTFELRHDKDRLVKTFIRGKGIEIGGPIVDWSSLNLKKVMVDHREFVPSVNSPSAFAFKGVDGSASTELVLTGIKSYSFDFVVANSILQSTEHTLAFLNQLLRIIHHHGYLLLSVPNACYGSNRNRVVTEWDHFEEEYARSSKVSSNRQEHLYEWALSQLNGKLPDNCSLTLDELVANFRLPASIPLNDTITASPTLLYDYHTWDQDSMMEFLNRVTHSAMSSPFSVKELVVHEAELLVLLQKL